MTQQITRREFSAGLVAAGAVAATRAAAFGAFAASERVRLGIIGVGNRGDQLIDAFLPHADAQITAICDVYEPYIEFAKSKVGGEPFITKDYRALLDRKDIDAVIIATPDHWHALQFVDACAAGKDVYVEKPLSLTIEEGRRMVAAAQRHNRISQMGAQRRSSPELAQAAQLIREGAIGQVTACWSGHITNESPMGNGSPPDCDPPPGLDWDMWLGPAPKVPYNPNRCLYKFRWFRDYSGGQLTNFGTHYLDVIQWALGQEAPLSVFALGGQYAVKDNREIPDTMQAIWEYPGGTLVTFSQYNANAAGANAKNAAIEFRGTNGTMYINGDGYFEIVPESVRTQDLPALSPLERQANRDQHRSVQKAREPLVVRRKDRPDVTTLHARNFLDGVKTRTPCCAAVEIGHRSSSTTLLANIALDRRRHLTWDAQQQRFTNDPEANKLLFYEYRPPWKLA